MKRITGLLILLLWSAGLTFAKPVDVYTAAWVGESFLLSENVDSKAKSFTELKLIYTESSDDISKNGRAQQTDFFYVFSSGADDFVIVSADDQVYPVLGYSTGATFSPDNIPPNVQKWLEGYKVQIRDVINHDIAATPEIEEAWLNYTLGNPSTSHARAGGVSPLITTKWDQGRYYNSQCPSGAPTGCVATAMAQIMKYWNYPATGSGFHSYNHKRYGTLSANFGGTSYQWSAMPNVVNRDNSAVATLMYQCGVSVDMDYSPQSSGAFVISSKSPVQHCSEYAFKTYFGYKKSIRGVERANYSQNQWLNMLKSELDAGRPMLYAGFGSGGGHAFVCDGYDNNSYFHFNWGWGGSYDGYFHINALNPSGTGIGGGSGGYNSGHQVLLGIEPGVGNSGGTNDKPIDMRVYSNLNMPQDRVWFKDPITVSVDVANYGNDQFYGEIGAAVFNEQNEFMDFFEVKRVSLGSMKYVTISFENKSSAVLVPGHYKLAVFYNINEEGWTIIGDGNYNNLKTFEVYYETDIEVNSNFTIKNNQGKLIQGTQAVINVDVTNTTKGDFVGSYRVNLSNLDGSWVQNIAIVNENQGLPSNYHYTKGLDFEGNITANPGTYLMEVAFMEQGTSGWYYAGSKKFANPIYVIVEAPDIQPDRYENNDEIKNAYSLPISFSGNTAVVTTEGANLHVGTDQDYYKIVLPVGHNYTISSRLHDSYNSGDGKRYSVDGLFSYSVDGNTWSDTYDDINSNLINITNGGIVYFLVAPYFAGETGTYLLGLTIQRVPVTGIKEMKQAELIRVYPNPAKDFVTVDWSAYPKDISEIAVYNIQGQQMKKLSLVSQNNRLVQLSLEGMPEGMYLIHMKSPHGILTRKIFLAP